LLVLLAHLAIISLAAHARAPRSYVAQVLRELPHEGAPFTQGLEFSPDEKTLVETSGAFPKGVKSFVRFVDPETGVASNQVVSGFDDIHLEGIVSVPAPEGELRWLVTSWNSKRAFELDGGFQIKRTFAYPLEGWGLARDPNSEEHLLATNGSEHLMRLNRGTLNVVESKTITCEGRRVRGLNELETVNNFLGEGPKVIGNVINTRIVLVIDPSTAECTGAFHLADLSEPTQKNEKDGYHVANGIAYRSRTGTLFVTGKNWGKMFEVKLHALPDNISGPEAAARLDALGMLREHLRPESWSSSALLQQTPRTEAASQESSKLERLPHRLHVRQQQLMRVERTTT